MAKSAPVRLPISLNGLPGLAGQYADGAVIPSQNSRRRAMRFSPGW